MTASDPIQMFEVMAKKMRNTHRVAGIAATIGSLSLLALCFVLPGSPDDKRARIIMGVLCLAGLAYGLYRLFQAVSVWDPARAPVVQLLRNKPESVVWVYEYRIVMNGVPSHNVHLNCRDGARFEFNIGGVDPKPLLAALRGYLPHAVFGYDDELKRKYESSPGSFAA